MNLKFYLRGLGVGMLVTAVVMAVLSGNGKESLSDEEIKSRARELGMIENVVLSEINSSPLPEDIIPENEMDEMVADEDTAIKEEGTPTETPDSSDTPTDTSDSSDTPIDTSDSSDTPIDTSDSSDTPIGTPDSSDTSIETSTTPATSGMGLPAEDVKESVSIEIKSGDGSFSVSKKLEAASVITSASDFDTFLCSNGYDKKIRVGSYTIPADADYEMIAAAIIVK